MKNSFQKFFGVLLVTTTIVACNKDDSKNGGDLRPLNVTTANIIGAWEIETQTADVRTSVPNTKSQFEITDTTIAAIQSSGNRVLWNRSADYVLQNGRIVTQNVDKNILPDLDILQITESTMQVRALVTNGSTNQELIWSLKRIDPSQLVGGSTGPTRPGGSWEESVQMEMVTPTLKFTYQDSFKGRRQQRSPLNCSYDRETSTFDLDLTAYRRGSDRRDDRDVEAQVSLTGRDVVFDFSRRHESVNFSIVNPRRQQRPAFVATYNHQGGRKIYFSTTRESRCNVTLTRQGKMVSFEAMCRELDANGDRLEGRARISLKGSCSL